MAGQVSFSIRISKAFGGSEMSYPKFDKDNDIATFNLGHFVFSHEEDAINRVGFQVSAVFHTLVDYSQCGLPVFSRQVSL